MSEDQLQPQDTLDDRGVDDVLDEGYSPPDHDPKHRAHNTLDERLAEEEPEAPPEYGDQEDDPAPPGSVGDERAGRLAPGENDVTGQDVGIDGGAASAEEAAMHVIDEPGA